MEIALFVEHLQRKLFVSQPKAVNLAKELIERFLPIKRCLKDFDATICSPSPLIDAAWHELILFTRLYAELCGKSFIHHNPAAELDEVEVKAQRYAKTLDAYEELFGVRPDDSDIWPAIYPGSQQEFQNHVTQEDDLSGKEEIDKKVRLNPYHSANRKRKVAEAWTRCARKSRLSPQLGNQTPPAKQSNTQFYNLRAVQRNICIIIKKLSGETFSLDMEPLETVDDLKNKVYESSGMPPDEQRLIFRGNQMQNDRTLSDYEVADGEVIHLVGRLRGC
jgi:hypothetical protein